MASDLGVFVVQRQTDGVWEADCCNALCGPALHGVAESIRQGDAEVAATRHRREIRKELAAAKERAEREPIDWKARAGQAERQLAVVTRKLRAMRLSCTCEPPGLVLIPTDKETESHG